MTAPANQVEWDMGDPALDGQRDDYHPGLGAPHELAGVNRAFGVGIIGQPLVELLGMPSYKLTQQFRQGMEDQQTADDRGAEIYQATYPSCAVHKRALDTATKGSLAGQLKCPKCNPWAF